jgi:hypothetical protein
MRPDLSKSYQSIQTALEFAIEAEENLNYDCQLVYDKTTPEGVQTYEVNALLEQWRCQKDICERLAKLLWNLNPEFKDERFQSADLAGNGVSHMRTYSERLHMGCLARAKART